MRLIIVRHGQTNDNLNRIMNGHSSDALTELGKKQAEKLAHRLKKETIDVIYSSDLKRCKQTIAPFLKLNKNIPIHYTKLLRETDYGFFMNKPFEPFVRWLKQMKDEGKNTFFTRTPNGESVEDTRRRTARLLKHLFEKEKEKNVLIVTHGGAKRTIMVNLFPKNLENAFEKYKFENASLSIVHIKEDGRHHPRLLSSIKHLEDLG